MDNQNDLEYPARSIRLSDDIWEEFKDKKIESGLTWNLFIRGLLKNKGFYGDPQINELTAFLKNELNLPVLDGSIKENRYYGKHCLNKFGLEEVKKIILKAKNNDFWSTKITGFKTLYYNGVKIQKLEDNNFIVKI